MTTPTPSPEAVEGAMKYALEDPTTPDGSNAWHVFIKSTLDYVPWHIPTSHCAARILAAEVERLRGELKVLKTDIRIAQEGTK
jgi:hypothetical protein